MTEADHDAQIKGFDATIGNTGYLREAYFRSEHYATKVLMPEAFNDNNLVLKDGRMFTEMTEEEKNLGEYETLGAKITPDVLKKRPPWAIKAIFERYPEASVMELKDTIQSFIDFVALHEKLESEGKATYIYASY